MFTKPEGAVANLEFMAQAMSDRNRIGKLQVEVFDRSGAKHTATTSAEARKLLTRLEMSK